MKLAIFERSTSATRPDAHVIAVINPAEVVVNYTDNEAQHLMEQIGMILDPSYRGMKIDFGRLGSHRMTHEYAAQLVNDLEVALQEWADYVNE